MALSCSAHRRASGIPLCDGGMHDGGSGQCTAMPSRHREIAISHRAHCDASGQNRNIAKALVVVHHCPLQDGLVIDEICGQQHRTHCDLAKVGSFCPDRVALRALGHGEPRRLGRDGGLA